MNIKIAGEEYKLSKVWTSYYGQRRISVYRNGKMVTNVRWSSKGGKTGGVTRARIVTSVLKNRSRNILPTFEIKEEAEEGKQLIYRVQKVYMLYGKEGNYPRPFAEVRVYVFTQKPDKYDVYVMDDYKRRVLYKYDSKGKKWSLRFTKWSNTKFEIDGFEKEPVEEDEVEGRLDVPMFYVKFMKTGTEVKDRVP